MKTLRPYQQEVLDQLKNRLKETEHPLLVNASVGAGKSLIIAELLRLIEKAGWRALCLTMNSTLIRQNADTYIKQGGHAGIYCASLAMKNTEEPIIFASPPSVNESIKQNGKFSKIPFNLIIIDECHNINVNDKNTIYMRIFNHYSHMSQLLGHKLRFVGLTGTPYRGRGHTIVGEKLFFKEEVCAITADWLIQENYLTVPIWGYCEKALQYDFQQLKVNAMGKFNSVELEKAIHKQPRLTAKIMAEVTEIVKNRKGAFIFASSIKHCQECAEWLPPEETAIITGDTPEKVREQYITQARAGIIKYLVNVNVLCTGVDVPTFDTVVFVRPTESLVLYVQCLGRGLRLADGKTNCLILDYAGNLDRHGDIDNPIINKAIQPRDENDPDYCIECFDCNTMNTLMTRRCIGSKENRRCDHWFEFKECPGCQTKNDIVSRQCRSCFIELIDPNAKLRNSASEKDRIRCAIAKTQYSLSIVNGHPRFEITYLLEEKSNPVPGMMVRESFLLSSKKATDFFYHTIVKLHFMHPNQAYSRVRDVHYLKKVIKNGEIYSPITIECVEVQGRLKVVCKKFTHEIVEDDLRQLDVIHTFYEFEEKTITFEYLVKENDIFKLIEDKYRFNIPSEVKRFSKHYGLALGDDIKTISDNSEHIETPSKIWVTPNNRMRKFVQDAPTVSLSQRQVMVLDRTNLSMAFEKWCEIIKFDVGTNHIAYDKNDKFFKVFYVRIIAHGIFDSWYSEEKIERLIRVSCNIAEYELDRLQSGQYRYLMPRADGRWAEDIEQWQTAEGKIFLKHNCFNYRC